MGKLYKNTSSRLAAVQIMYALETSGGKEIYELENIEEHLHSRLDNYKDEELLKEYALDDEQINKKFTHKLLQAVISRFSDIDKMIEENSDSGSSVERMNLLMLSLLRCAIAELKYFDTPFKVVIKEYIKVSVAFFGESERSFVNAILDKISKENE